MSLHPSYAARWRFGLAGFLRRSEQIVDGMVSRYENVTTLDDQDAAEIYQTMGDDFARKGMWGDAIAAFEQTLERTPHNGAARCQLGLAQVASGAYPEAIETLERAHADGVDSFELYYGLAEAHSELEQPEQAVSAFHEALERKPDMAEAAYRLGVVLDELERYPDAAAAFRWAIRHQPREANYHQSLGFTLESMGRRDEALRSFKRAINLERRQRR
jgi:tetratricopeptide (TPR) repeat protein